MDIKILDRRLKAGSTIVYAIYDRPDDFPKSIFVRPHKITPSGSEPLKEMMIFGSIEEAQEDMKNKGLECLGRELGDETQIVESWM